MRNVQGLHPVPFILERASEDYRYPRYNPRRDYLPRGEVLSVEGTPIGFQTDNSEWNE